MTSTDYEDRRASPLDRSLSKSQDGQAVRNVAVVEGVLVRVARSLGPIDRPEPRSRVSVSVSAPTGRRASESADSASGS